MRFEVSSSELLKQLNIAAGVITPNPVLPIAEDFLFKLKGNELEVTATNIDTTVITHVAVNGILDGVIAIPAKMMIETLKALPEQPISLALNDEGTGVVILSSYGKYNLAADNVEEFPELPSEDGVETFSFDSFKLSTALSSTVNATSNDELRLAMTGVFMQVDFNKLLLVATDAHKLVKYTYFNINTDISTSVILPKKAINLLKNSLPDHGIVDISLNPKNAFFSFGGTKIITRLVDAKYPDYNAVIPVDNPNELIVNKKDLQNSLRRIGIYANKSTNQVILNITDSGLTLSARDLDFANEATEQLPCRYSGEPMTMGFNAKIFADLLGNIETEDAILELSVPSRAGILVPSEQEDGSNLMMLVMPVLSNY